MKLIGRTALLLLIREITIGIEKFYCMRMRGRGLIEDGIKAMFVSVSVFEYVTIMDLSKIGTFVFMGLIGLIIVSVVNLFLRNEMLYWIISYVGCISICGFDGMGYAVCPLRAACVYALLVIVLFISCFYLITDSPNIT